MEIEDRRKTGSKPFEDVEKGNLFEFNGCIYQKLADEYRLSGGYSRANTAVVRNGKLTMFCNDSLVHEIKNARLVIEDD